VNKTPGFLYSLWIFSRMFYFYSIIYS
jgi:hypothetical protein